MEIPNTVAAIERLGASHAERQRALGMSETHYFAVLRGEIPVILLRRWLRHEEIVAALRRDLGFEGVDVGTDVEVTNV